MFRFVGALTLITCSGLLLPSARCDDDLDALLKKMVAARGGAKLAHLQAYRLNLRSDLLSGDKKIAISGSLTVRGVDFIRMETRMGNRHDISVLSKDRGWLREGGKTREMTRDEVAAEREGAFHSWVSMTLHVAEPGITFQRLPTVKEATRSLLGLKISKKEMPDLELWVDAATYLPVRQRFQFLRPDGTPVTMESRTSEHKTVDGVVISARTTTYRNGERWLETEVVRAEFFADGKDLDFSKP